MGANSVGANSPWGKTSIILFSIMPSGAIAEHLAHFQQHTFFAPAVTDFRFQIFYCCALFTKL